ncbi:MAG: head-tail connector protein [Petrotogales bacterium]
MLEEVKNYLKVTWDDEDDNIQNIIDRGKKRIEVLAGASLDFDEPGLAKDLLLNYCRYDYNNAVEYFEENFQKEILRLQLETGVNLLACLSDLTIEGLTLDPEFELETYEYTAETTDDENVIIATAINEDAEIEITVNDEEYENETEYTWQSGENEVEIIVTDGSSEKIYTITVTKA